MLIAAGLLVRTVRGPGPLTAQRINRAEARVWAGDTETALAELQEILQVRITDARAWMRVGRVLRTMGRRAEAAVHYRKAAELDPDSARLRFELARALLEAGFPALAEQAADETLLRKPEHAGAHYVKAAVLGSRGDTPGAAEHIASALDGRPWHPDRYRGDPSFDPVRNALAFQEAVLPRRVPGVFREE